MNKIMIGHIGQTKQGRFSLFDGLGEFLFSVDGDTLISCNITKGMMISEEDLSYIKSKSDFRKAKNKAYEYLSMRDYATKELLDKLKLKFDEDTARSAVDEMIRLELLDDEKFARHRASYLVKQKKSLTQIRQKLSFLGIDRETISDVLSEYENDEEELITALVEKSYLRKLEAGQKDKVFAALMRRGFKANEIRKVLEKLTSEDY